MSISAVLYLTDFASDLRSLFVPRQRSKSRASRALASEDIKVELKKPLRSGDIGSKAPRQFENFNAYLVPAQKFAALKEADELPLAIDADCEHYLQARLRLDALHAQLKLVDELAGTNELPDAILTDSGLNITPLDASPPHVKTTKLPL